MNVIIIDDHPIVRAGIKAVLAATEDIRVVAEGENAADALALTRQHQPDVLVLDVNLPDQSGVDVTRQLRSEGARTAILILTVHKERQMVFGLLESGANGYVLKDDALEILPSAVRAVARGKTWLSPVIAGKVVRQAVAQAGPALSPAAQNENALTRREYEVLQLLAQGLGNAAIAERLVVTKRTVQNHVSNIYSKLGVASRTEATLYALRHGWVQITSAEKDAEDW